MIERLNQLSLTKYIDLICGDGSVLLGSEEKVSDGELKARIAELIVEYKSIVNPVGIRAMMIDKEDLMKCRIKIQLLRVCKALVGFGAYSDVRSSLGEISCCDSIKDEDLPGEIDNLLRMAEFEKKRMEDKEEEEREETVTPERIRSSFDSEIAFLMTYFKMPIDPGVISASVYANIVHQADTEIRLKKIRNPL